MESTKYITILAAGIQPSFLEKLATKTLHHRIQMLPTDTQEHLLKGLIQNDVRLLLIDPTAIIPESRLKEIINTTREKSPISRIVVFSSDTQPESIKRLIDMGIGGFIAKASTIDIIVEKMIGYIDKADPTAKERRQHVRIAPDSQDTLRFDFRVQTLEQPIQGNITNISLGGALIIADQDIPNYSVTEGNVIRNFQISLNGKLSITDSKVILLRGRQMAVQFLDAKENFKLQFASYIYQQLLKK